MSLKQSENLSKKSNYHHGNVREELLNAGLVHLENNDAESLSFREMARQIGVSANAVYRHFENKDSFLVALAAKGFQRLQDEQIQTLQYANSQPEALKLFGLAYINFAKNNRNLFALMFNPDLQKNDAIELKEAVDSTYTQLQRLTASILRLSEDDAQVEVLAMLSCSLVHGLSHLLLEGRLAESEEKANNLVLLIMNYATSLLASSAEINS
ncbi:TetR/AcrR family transcriptional regulator [Acinetobacter baumannii]|uniref:TetR/AcrR family transcriptional regulator n=1 Tax=Acinetobacter baumannii TaxID=470 RepID=UPI00244804AA|nr:TetR/AcrR family transcriptional regulator [Acinetobacter baumannii]MDH2497393.1 TetR/AcrR family transcriptional regulator [Acinetobacter baumannii]MDV7612450.1 TetR/AcrR family transcriptional regulator [Acinetobacter baumannii]